MVTLFKNIWGTVSLFPKNGYTIFIPSSRHKASIFCFLMNTCDYLSLILAARMCVVVACCGFHFLNDQMLSNFSFVS